MKCWNNFAVDSFRYWLDKLLVSTMSLTSMHRNIYSIGYGSRTIDIVVKQLSRAEIEYVIDVRSSPFSRFKPDFSRDSLSESLKSHGIKYVFMGDLLGGRPKDDDCYTDGKADYKKIESKPFFKKGIGRLSDALKQGLNICLLCSEGMPSQCHRSKLIAVSLEEIGLSVTHIMPDGTYASQEDVMLSLTDGQGDMFGDHFTSRKAYR